MFPRLRRYQTCAHCQLAFDSPESPASQVPDRCASKEHIFGSGIKRRFIRQFGRPPYARSHTRSFKSTNDDRDSVDMGQTVLDFAPYVLCRECNHGVLGREMGQTIPVIWPIIQGLTRIEVTEGGAELIRRYFERLAIIMDLCTSNHEVTPAYRESDEFIQVARFRRYSPYLSKRDRECWAAGRPLSSVKIRIARSSGWRGSNPPLAPLHFPQQVGPMVRDCKRVVTAIGALAAIIDIGPVIAPGVDRFIGEFRPLPAEGFVWPPDGATTDDADIGLALEAGGDRRLGALWAGVNRSQHRKLMRDYRSFLRTRGL